MIRQDRSFGSRSTQIAARRARKWAFTLAALLVGSWWPGAAQQRTVVTPSPAVGVQTWHEGNYEVHIFENQGARDVAAADRSVLVLGSFSGPASTFNAANYINPDTGRRFDVVIGLKSNDLGSEAVRILAAHVDAEPDAAAVKSAIAKQFQGPLAVGTVTLHSNGNPVGITDVLDGAFTGVKQINMVEPDIGYGGKYVSEGSFQQLKTAGVNTVNIYRNPISFVTRLGELSAAIGDPIIAGTGEAVNAVSRETMGMTLIQSAVSSVQGVNDVAAAPNSPNRPTVNVFDVQTRSTTFGNPAASVLDHYAQENLSSIFAFKNDTRVITPVTSQSVPPSPKGVHILIREEVLAKALSQGTPKENLTLLAKLGAAIRANRDEASVQAAIEEFCDALKVRFKNGQNPTQLRDTIMVSLRTVADRAAPYVDRWSDLPEALRYPGGITRIHGYVVVPERNDLVLIGTRGASEARIELDDLIVGLKAVWHDGQTPFCSLDPDPQAIDGPQTVRVDGVPSDSGFALKMLNADYLMKRILLGLEASKIDRYDSYRAILARSTSARPSANRFWAYPFQPQAGEIQISPDMHEALYSSGVQILTEEMMRTQDGFTGIGAVNPEAEEAAKIMTARFANLATEHPSFQRLQGLFDIVLTARLLRHTHIESEALDRLVRLPRATVRIAPTYQGLKVSFQGPNRMIVLGGGVHAKTNATDRSLLALTDQSFRDATLTARTVSERSMVATEAATPFTVVAPDPTRRDRAQLTLLSARAKLRSNDPAGALNDINLAIKSDETDPELRAFRAILSVSRGDVAQARTDALSAQSMDPDNPQVETITSTILFQCDLLEGKPDLAMQWIERSLRSDPSSASAHARRAEALLALGRAADARGEFRKAVTADPTSALAVARLARLEISEGWLTTGRRLVQKANDLSANLNQRIPEVQVAQAEAALALAFYGNVRSQIAEASRIAEELLADKACDLPSAVGAYRVLVRAALLTGDLPHADALVIRARGVSPTSPSVLIEAASTALQIGRADIARKYITEALTLAPNNVALLQLNRALKR